jgi:LysR family transcriptional regulator, transcriptional activator of nhaA
MEWLNYHHLLYFWVVAKRGSIAQASRELRLAHPTISAQIRQLEEVLGDKLFERTGRRLVLTEFGRVAFGYAEEIFLLGREFMDAAKKRPRGRPIRFVVGVSDALPKSVVYRILEPVFRLEEDLRVVCREDRSPEEFMAELAMHTIDVLLSDAPARPGTSIRAFSHPIGECGTAFLAAPELATACRGGFPRSLDGVPFLLPGGNSALRQTLEEWFESLRIRPKIVAEFDDAALSEIAGEAGLGVFAVPDVVDKKLQQRYKVQLISRVRDVQQRFYAISIERKIRHPAVAAISDAARKNIFG